MRFGEVDYGKWAATIAAGVIAVMGGFATAFIPFVFNLTNANLDVLIPAQSVFGPAAFLTYLWMKRHYGRERTMAEYLASQDGAAAAPQVEQAPAPEPASI
jgi:nitrate/nitrite transporter NarK